MFSRVVFPFRQILQIQKLCEVVHISGYKSLENIRRQSVIPLVSCLDSAKFFKGRHEFSSNVPTDGQDRCTVFVKNIPFSASKANVAALFESVTNVRLPLDERGQPRGFAFVEFENEEAANAILNNKEGYELKGRQLIVGRPGQRTSRSTTPFSRQFSDARNFQEPSGPTRTLMLKNLPFSMESSQIKDYFKSCTNIRMPVYHDTGKPRGIAFVDFASVEDAEKAMQLMQGQILDGREVTISFAVKQEMRGDAVAAAEPSSTLFLKNVSSVVDVDQIKKTFVNCTSVHMPAFRVTGKPKGFAFVSFASVDDAEKAMKSTDVQTLLGQDVTVAFAKPREEGEGGSPGFRGGFRNLRLK